MRKCVVSRGREQWNGQGGECIELYFLSEEDVFTAAIQRFIVGLNVASTVPFDPLISTQFLNFPNQVYKLMMQ